MHRVSKIFLSTNFCLGPNESLSHLIASNDLYIKIHESKTYPNKNSVQHQPQVPGRVRIPADLLGGKDRIVFGNIRDIYEFHKRSVSTVSPFILVGRYAIWDTGYAAMYLTCCTT